MYIHHILQWTTIGTWATMNVLDSAGSQEPSSSFVVLVNAVATLRITWEIDSVDYNGIPFDTSLPSFSRCCQGPTEAFRTQKDVDRFFSCSTLVIDLRNFLNFLPGLSESMTFVIKFGPNGKPVKSSKGLLEFNMVMLWSYWNSLCFVAYK